MFSLPPPDSLGYSLYIRIRLAYRFCIGKKNVFILNGKPKFSFCQRTVNTLMTMPHIQNYQHGKLTKKRLTDRYNSFTLTQMSGNLSLLIFKAGTEQLSDSQKAEWAGI